MKVLTSAFLAIALIFKCCNIETPKERIDINAITRYVELVDTFDLLILNYVASLDCDTIYGASETIGIIIPDKDTLKIYSMCNTDTTFKSGMIVKVAPSVEPKIKELHMRDITIKKGRENVYPEIYQKSLKYTFGRLIKIN